VRMRLSRVVLPAPRKPVRIVTGTILSRLRAVFMGEAKAKVESRRPRLGCWGCEGPPFAAGRRITAQTGARGKPRSNPGARAENQAWRAAARTSFIDAMNEDGGGNSIFKRGRSGARNCYLSAPRFQ